MKLKTPEEIYEDLMRKLEDATREAEIELSDFHNYFKQENGN